MYDIEFYHTSGSNVPLKKFLRDISKSYGERDLAIIKSYIDLLGQYGMRINDYKPRSMKPIEGDLYELRPGNNRIFFFYFKENRIVLLHGFRKKQRKTPRHEIETAKERMEDYKRRFS